MWRIYNYLFGWDYIAWKNSCDCGVARVNKQDNRVSYCRYKNINCWDVIREPEQVIWLTCSSQKYFPLPRIINAL